MKIQAATLFYILTLGIGATPAWSSEIDCEAAIDEIEELKHSDGYSTCIAANWAYLAGNEYKNINTRRKRITTLRAELRKHCLNK